MRPHVAGMGWQIPNLLMCKAPFQPRRGGDCGRRLKLNKIAKVGAEIGCRANWLIDLSFITETIKVELVSASG